jgi:hypothetical protein
MNNLNNKMAGRQLFENCREYIPEEIEVLKPDILVTQGDWANRRGQTLSRAVRRAAGRAHLPVALHPPRRHLKSPADFSRR